MSTLKILYPRDITNLATERSYMFNKHGNLIPDTFSDIQEFIKHNKNIIGNIRIAFLHYDSYNIEGYTYALIINNNIESYLTYSYNYNELLLNRTTANEQFKYDISSYIKPEYKEQIFSLLYSNDITNYNLALSIKDAWLIKFAD